MGSVSVWLLSLVLCWGFPSPHTTLSHAAVYYITPHSPNPDCPSGEPCLTINEYAQGNHFDGDDNITLLFLNGEHNLTVQSFKIANKTLLEMATSHGQARVEVVIQNDSIIVQNVSDMNISGLKFTSGHKESKATCLSVTDIGQRLAITMVTIESCEIQLLGEMEAIISELTASNSSAQLLLSQYNHSVAIKNSSFSSSTLNISTSLTGQVVIGDTKSALSIENSLMINSQLKVELETPIVYELSIINTSLTSQSSPDTGVAIEVLSTSTLHAIIKNSDYVGNFQGIDISANGNSHVKLSVEQCRIMNNGNAHSFRGFGIGITADGNSSVELNVVRSLIAYNGHYLALAPDYVDLGGISISRKSMLKKSDAVVIASIESTSLIGNKYVQVGVEGSSGTTTVTLFNCTVSGGSSGSAGLYLNGGQSLQKCMHINISKSDFQDSQFGVWVDSLPQFKEPEIDTCAIELHISDNSISSLVVDPRSSIDQGYGLQVSRGIDISVNITNCFFTHNKHRAMNFRSTSGLVTISETVITQNGVGIQLTHDTKQKNLSLSVEDSLFQENSGLNLGVPQLVSSSTTFFAITVRNVTFLNNTNLGAKGGIVQADGSVDLSIEDSCVFRGNLGSPIQALETTVTLSGSVLFENNMAFEGGGAISMRLSMLRFRSVNATNTSIAFVNNTAANVGGGIYIKQLLNSIIDSSSGSVCFYELQGVSQEEVRNSAITVAFENNTAANGGSDIFGAALNSQCQIKFENPATTNFSNEVQKHIFKMSSTLSSISSNPMRVCLSDVPSEVMCANLSYIFYETERYPGEVFPLSLAVVGLEFGTVTSPVYAYLVPQANNSASSLGDGNDQHLRQASTYPHKINQFNFSVNSLNSREIIALTRNNTVITETGSREYISQILHTYYKNLEPKVIPAPLLAIYVYVNVTLLDCPPGFQLTNQGRCECAKVLKEFGINDCSIYDRVSYISRNLKQWFKQVPDGILASKYCPYNYCKQGAMVINLDDPDEQCALNHTGTLCGACPSDLSLAIGSSRCLECSDNYHTLLVIAFAVAGIALILFIKILDMTVAIGTINGLIFYANIIWANQSVLFPPQDQTSSLLQFLKVFIAWLNLDLGIETCFIQHLDGYWKTWLQFVFPVYIWLIAGLIILLSHYSIRATKLFGRNSVSVLATLFLLSYAKLLRTVLDILKFTVLEYSDGSRTVWSFDGNIPYFDLKHSILFVLAIVILLVLWSPYTFVLFFMQYLRRYSHRRLLKWVDKMKPLLDCYSGPLKDKHNYWIGLGLLARLVLLLTSAATLTTAPYVSVVALILTTFALGLLVLSVYKQWQLSVLEGCFLVNTAMFSSGALFIEAQGGSKDTLACISLGIAFTLFLVITAYHIFRRLRSLKKKRKHVNVNHGYEDIEDSIQLPQQLDHDKGQSTTYQEVSVSQLREPLLESVS